MSVDYLVLCDEEQNPIAEVGRELLDLELKGGTNNPFAAHMKIKGDSPLMRPLMDCKIKRRFLLIGINNKVLKFQVRRHIERYKDGEWTGDTDLNRIDET